MKFLNKDIALCLVPHPDDTALCMSGLVKQYKDTIFHMLYLSAGTMTDETAGPNRFAEDLTFWRTFGVNNIIIDKVEGCTFDTSPQSKWITTIEAKQIQFDVVFSTPKLDGHYEHVLTNAFMTPLTRFKPLTLVEYKTTSVTHEWTPNLFVEMSDELLEEKCKCLLTSFPSQADATYFKIDSLKAFHLDYISKKRGYGFCESFKINQLYL